MCFKSYCYGRVTERQEDRPPSTREMQEFTFIQKQRCCDSGVRPQS